MEKFDARKLSKEARQEIRYQVIRLKKQGWKRYEISEITGVHKATITNWWKLYKDGGRKALKLKKRGPEVGVGRTLSSNQEKELQKAIYDKCPDQMKLPFALWTRRTIQLLIKQLWSIDMPIRTVGEYLKRWALRHKGPCEKPINRTQRPSKNGLLIPILKLKNSHKLKMQKSIGVMKLAYAMTATMVGVMRQRGKLPKLKFIHGVKGLI